MTLTAHDENSSSASTTAIPIIKEGRSDSAYERLKKKLPSTPKALKQFGICGGVFIFFGILLLVAAVLAPKELRHAVRSGLRTAVVLDGPQASGFDNWRDNKDNPLVLSLYVMDITNPEEVLAGATPVAIERGPYVYTERRTNFNISWFDDGARLQYKQWSRFTFVPELSVESDTARLVTSLNMPFMALRAILPPSLMMMLPSIYQQVLKLTQSQILFVQRTPRELLWGYTDPALSVLQEYGVIANSFYPGFFKNYSDINTAAQKLGMNEIYTGKNDLSHIRDYIRWNNMSSLTVTPECVSQPPCPTFDVWGSTSANAVKGCDGSQFHPPVTSQSKPLVWFSSYFRSITLQYMENIVYKGITLLRFQFPQDLYMNSTQNPVNAPYWQLGTPYGLVNVSMEVQGVPAFFSNPRFINADPQLINAVEIVSSGSMTEPQLSCFDVEPYSGSSFHAVASSQFNVHVTPLLNLPLSSGNTTTWFPNLKPVYLPVFWASEEGSISDADASSFKDQVYGAIFLEDIAVNLGYPFGSLFVVIGLFIVVYVFRQFGCCGYGYGYLSLSERTNILIDTKADSYSYREGSHPYSPVGDSSSSTKREGIEDVDISDFGRNNKV